MRDPFRRELLKALGLSAALGGLPFAARLAGAADSALNIGVIGSGKVGSALGRVWAGAGHAVMFSSQNIGHDQELAKQVGSKARAGSPAEAAAFGEVLLFAVPYGALPDLGKALAGALNGKVAFDACNPFASRDGAVADRALERGAGLMSAQLLPGAHIIRAFNAVSAARMGQAHEDPGHFGMPIAGDDRKAIETASRLVREIGYEPVLIGGLAMGKFLMPGTPLAGEHTPQEIRSIAATLHA
jgi:predicted dinucleotide-binding enzyme